MGGEEGWLRLQADVQIGIMEGRYDSRDMPVVIASLRRWIGSP
jgi:hypothetical protein